MLCLTWTPSARRIIGHSRLVVWGSVLIDLATSRGSDRRGRDAMLSGDVGVVVAVPETAGRFRPATWTLQGRPEHQGKAAVKRPVHVLDSAPLKGVVR